MFILFQCTYFGSVPVEMGGHDRNVCFMSAEPSSTENINATDLERTGRGASLGP